MAAIRTTCALLALALCGASVSAQSFAQQKDAFETGFASNDQKVRTKAIEDISTHAHPETVRYLLTVIRDVTDKLTEARSTWAEATVKRGSLRREESRLRQLLTSGRIGRKQWERAKAELAAVEAQCKEHRRIIELDSGIGVTLRKAVGWTVSRCSEAHKRSAISAVTTAYRRAKEIEDKADVLRIMVWVDLPEMVAAVERETRHREAPTRVAALRAIEERGGLRALRPAVARLKDDSWQVRAQAIRILRKVGGSEAAESLCDALEGEDGRLVTDAVSALRKITGQNFHDNVHLWREWIGKNGDALAQPTEIANAPPLPKKRAPVAKRGARHQAGTGFYGINTRSKHIVYVIDFSGSMSGPLGGRGPGGPGGNGPAKVGGTRKVDGAVTELLKSIDSLPKGGTFNVILFESGVTIWKDKMVPANQKSKKAIRQWLLEKGPLGATDLFGGLEKGFGFAGRGSFDRHYQSAVDTIFLLSDGSPSAGRIQATEDILREIRALNDLRRIAVHCVGLGRAINAGFLRRLAGENDGEFVHVTK